MRFDPIAPHLRARAFRCLVPDVLSPTECAGYIDRAEHLGFAAAPITTASGPVMRPDIRDNTRVMFDDVELAEAIWPRLAEALPTRIGGRLFGLNERFRVYRYDPGQRFDWHRDGAYHRSARERSVLSLLIYLNDGMLGGATEFTHDAVAPRAGAALAFAHPMLHRGAPVGAGRKYVLRTDVMARVS